MTRKELFKAMHSVGYAEDFIEDLRSDVVTTTYLLRLMNSGETDKAWAEIRKMFDEHVYFDLYDDTVVCMTNEAWMIS